MTSFMGYPFPERPCYCQPKGAACFYCIENERDAPIAPGYSPGETLMEHLCQEWGLVWERP